MPVTVDPRDTLTFYFTTVDGREVKMSARSLTFRQQRVYEAIVREARGLPTGSPECDAVLNRALAIATTYTVDTMPGDLTDADVRLTVEYLPRLLSVRYDDAAQINVAAARHCGKLCDQCIGGRCHDPPTEKRPLLVTCPRCENLAPAVTDCDFCGTRGTLPVTTCPVFYVHPSIWEAVRAAARAEAGQWPVAGGTLDQSDSFLKFISYWEHAVARLTPTQPGA